MRAYLISDNHDTQVGLRMAGIEGVVVHGSEETRLAVEEALTHEDISILVVTELAASQIPDMIQNLRERSEAPIVVEIPDRHGTRRDSDFLTKYVRDAIGVKME